MELARLGGCYKVILSCDTSNATFYEKCGFENKGAYMVRSQAPLQSFLRTLFAPCDKGLTAASAGRRHVTCPAEMLHDTVWSQVLIMFHESGIDLNHLNDLHVYHITEHHDIPGNDAFNLQLLLLGTST